MNLGRRFCRARFVRSFFRTATINQHDPNFLADQQSVANLVSQLHSYFKNSYSHYKIERSKLLSELEAVTGEQEAQIQRELAEIDGEITIFGVLSDSLSVADRVIHAKGVMKELGINSGVYRRHTEEQTQA